MLCVYEYVCVSVLCNIDFVAVHEIVVLKIWAMFGYCFLYFVFQTCIQMF
jgi:hypothetical protein